MTIGIYALFWAKSDCIYIGQSQNIELRFTAHKNHLINGTHKNNRVQEQYIKYGLPEFSILERTELDCLDLQEKSWAMSFDNLLNITEPGEKTGRGVNAAHSIYSKEIINTVFQHLLDNKLSIKSIAEITNMTPGNVRAIAHGVSHVWLAKEYDYAYTKMLAYRKPQGTQSKSVISPEGTVLIVQPSYREFCTEHNLSLSRLSDLVNNKIKIYKGWTAYKN